MAILVTGGAGFVGSHLCDRLIADGEPVVCMDNLSTGRIGNIAHLLGRAGFAFLECDVTEPLPELPKLECVYHLASPASPKAYAQMPIETLRANSLGTERILELSRVNGARFLFASSSEVYGDPLEHPQSEGYAGNVNPIGPRSMYDEGKRFGEALTVAFGRSRGVQVRIARIFNTYGPRMAPDDGRVVSNFVVQAMKGEPMTIYGTGTQTRSFQYVDDLVAGLIALMQSDYSEPVNLGNPFEVTMIELAEIVRRLAGSQSSLAYSALPQDDPQRRLPQIAVAEQNLGWAPTVNLETGLRWTIAYFRELLASESGRLDDLPGDNVTLTPTDIVATVRL